MAATGRGTTKEPEPARPISHVHPDVPMTLGSLTSEDAAELARLVDYVEKDTADPDAALATLAGLVDRKIATRRPSGAVVEGDATEQRGSTPPVVYVPGGAMPSQTATPIMARRAFVGYDREREAYDRRKAKLLVDAEGQYVVLVGDEMMGPFVDHGTAERAGYSRFGLGPLFIKQVLAEERVIEVTRLVAQ